MAVVTGTMLMGEEHIESAGGMAGETARGTACGMAHPVRSHLVRHETAPPCCCRCDSFHRHLARHHKLGQVLHDARDS